MKLKLPLLPSWMALCLFALAPSASAVTVLFNNASFEDPDISGPGFSTSMQDWISFGGDAGTVENGRFSSALAGGDGANYAFLGISSGFYQDVATVNAGGNGFSYDLLAGFAISDDITIPGNPGTTTLRLAVLNLEGTADEVIFDTVINNATLNTSQFQYFNVSAEIDPSLDGRTIRLVVFGNGNADNSGRFALSTDNWSLTQVPEPGPALLLPATLLACALRRRKLISQ